MQVVEEGEIIQHQQLERGDKVEVVPLEYMDQQIQQLQELIPREEVVVVVPVNLELLMD